LVKIRIMGNTFNQHTHTHAVAHGNAEHSVASGRAPKKIDKISTIERTKAKMRKRKSVLCSAPRGRVGGVHLSQALRAWSVCVRGCVDFHFVVLYALCESACQAAAASRRPELVLVISMLADEVPAGPVPCASPGVAAQRVVSVLEYGNCGRHPPHAPPTDVHN